jgi:hypothetical protein
VRIRTNLAIYWGQVRVSVDAPAAPLRLTSLAASQAELHYLGYPAEVRRSPENYDYSRVQPTFTFNKAQGNYTRYGDVKELLRATDDRYVIMASGDEVALRFDSRSLPPLPGGWARTLFFCADAFTKASDFYDAFPGTVAPLPLHARSYPPSQPARSTLKQLDYALRYNTRHIASVTQPE